MIADSVREQLGQPSKGRGFAEDLMRSLEAECKGSNKRPDDVLRDILLDESFGRVEDRPLAETILLTFFFHRLARASLWHHVADTYIPDSQRFRALRSCVERYRRVMGADYAYHSCLGALSIAAGDLVQAASSFAKACEMVPDDSPMAPQIQRARTFRNPWEMTTELMQTPPSSLFVRGETRQRGQPRAGASTVVVSCDAAYFERFGPEAVRSLFDAGFAGNLVIACVNLGRFAQQALAEVEGRVDAAGANVTFLDFPFEGRDFPSFSQCLRFIAARECLEEGHEHVVVTDIDYRFAPEVLAEYERDRLDASGYLALTRPRFGRTVYPWQAIYACAQTFKRNPPSQFFLRLVQRYVETVFDPDVNNRGIDQNALFAAWQIVEKTVADHATRNLWPFQEFGLSFKDENTMTFKRRVRKVLFDSTPAPPSTPS